MNLISKSDLEAAEYLRRISFSADLSGLEQFDKEAIEYHADKQTILEKTIEFNNKMVELTELITRSEYDILQKCESIGIKKERYETENTDLLIKLEIIETILLKTEIMHTFLSAQQKVNGTGMKRRS